MSISLNAQDHIFLSVITKGCYRSTDEGASWQLKNTGLTNLFVRGNLVDKNGHIWVASEAGLFRSSDNADSWQLMLPGLFGGLYQDSTFALVTVNDLGFYRSTNGGDNWQHSASPTGVGILGVHPDGSYVGAKGESAVYRSTDFGATWVNLNNPYAWTGYTAAMTFNGAGDIFYARDGDAAGVAMSTNMGATWGAVNTGLTTTRVIPIICHPNGFLFVGTNGGGVFRTRISTALTGPTGALEIAIYDGEEWTRPGASARAELYNSSGAQIAQAQANSSSVVTFEMIPPGSGYSYKVFVNKPSAWGEEYWGAKSGITVVAEQTTSESFVHNTPYMPEVGVYIDDPNEFLPEGGKRSIAPGTPLRIELTVKNPGYDGAMIVSAYGELRLDRNRIEPYDVHLSTSPQVFAIGETKVLVFHCSAPEASGEYYLSVGVHAHSETYAEVLTNAGDWHNPSFLIPFPPVPKVLAMSPLKGAAGSSVVLSGENFSTDASRNKVYFGPVRADVTSVSENSIETTAPAGSGSDFLTVTVDGLSCRSPQAFSLVFGATGDITSRSFAGKIELQGGQLLHGTTADLDGDGRPELVEADLSGVVSIYRNVSSIGSLSPQSFLGPFNIAAGRKSKFVQRGDIDGDGKLDLVCVNNGSSSVSVFRNTSAGENISFERQDFGVMSLPQRLAIADLDGDGKSEIVVTGSAPVGVVVLPNASTPGTISFQQALTLNTGRGCNGIALADIDGDGPSDIVITNGIGFSGEAGSLTVYRNQSLPGQLQFTVVGDFPCGNAAVAIAVADLDEDSKLDVILASGSDGSIPEKRLSLYRNTSAPGAMSFTRSDLILNNSSIWSIGVADLNGDGKNDVAVTSPETRSVAIFQNQSTPGTLALAPRMDFPTRDNPFSVDITDLDLDGRPDVVVASYPGTGVSVLRNASAEESSMPPWSFINTGTTHTVIIPATIEANVGGAPLVPGDYVGVFYDSGGTPVCAGFERWTDSSIAISAFGDDLTSGAKDGFAQGEAFQWKIFRAGDWTVYDAEATYDAVGGVITHTWSYAPNGISQLASLVGGHSTHTLALRSGWNLISSYVKPESNALDDIFAAVLPDLIILKNGSQHTYIPSVQVNTIGPWIEAEGYQIKMAHANGVTFTGEQIQPWLQTIGLPVGWSIMPYIRNTPMAITSALSGVADAVVLVKDEDGKTYIPSAGVDGIGMLKVGRGYQLKMAAARTLEYTVAAGPVETPSHAFVASPAGLAQAGPPWSYSNTGRNHTCIIPLSSDPGVDGTPLVAGDCVGAFYDSAGVLACAGYECWTGTGNIAVALFGDDATTVAKDGLANGEEIRWKIWRHSDDRVTAARATYFAPGAMNGLVTDTSRFTENGISGIATLVGNVTGVAGTSLPSQHSLKQNYPNPFNPSTRIAFGLAEHCHVKITVLNTMGQEVAELVNGARDAGYHEVVFDAEGLATGVYLCRMVAGGVVQTRKLLYLR